MPTAPASVAYADLPPAVAADYRRSDLWTRLADQLARRCANLLVSGFDVAATKHARRSVAAHQRALEAYHRGREKKAAIEGMH